LTKLVRKIRLSLHRRTKDFVLVEQSCVRNLR